MTARSATAALALTLLAGCGLTPTREVEDIDPRGLPGRLVVIPTASTAEPPNSVSPGGSVYFVREETLVRRTRAADGRELLPRVQSLLDTLTGGPDETDRDRGVSTALPPATVLRATALEGTVVTVDLAVDQLPSDQTLAIAQIVLTVTSLNEVGGVRLTVNGEPIRAPLASGAQTDRPLTRADFAEMAAAGLS
ncbi:MAG: GerMN domain-containing protein [Sporichthyaceae bacterium]